jgi:hypothetical protein
LVSTAVVSRAHDLVLALEQGIDQCGAAVALLRETMHARARHAGDRRLGSREIARRHQAEQHKGCGQLEADIQMDFRFHRRS